MKKIITYSFLSCIILTTQSAFAMFEEPEERSAGPMLDSRGRLEGILITAIL